jgi:hypothetical protein
MELFLTMASKVSKKFWEELIAYISFTTVPVFVQAEKTLSYVCVMKSIEQYNMLVLLTGGIYELRR